MNMPFKFFTLTVLLSPSFSFASNSTECDDLKYIGTSKLSVLIGVQDVSPAYKACISETKFSQESTDLDAEYPAKSMADEKFRQKFSDIDGTHGGLRDRGTFNYAIITDASYQKFKTLKDKNSGSGLSFGHLSNPISTAPGYETLSGGEPH